MSTPLRSFTSALLFLFSMATSVATPRTAGAQSAAKPDSSEASTLYAQLKAASLTPESFTLENFVLQRDRVTMTFTNGTLFLGPAIAGKIRSAVFIGSGTFHAVPPSAEFERDNVRRLLKADDVTTDFKTAVLRFADDTADLFPRGARSSTQALQQAERLAGDLEPRLLRETGINLSARELEAILNNEPPGFFIARFEGGKRGKFTFLLDPQARIPVANFEINAGERGLIFAYDENIYYSDVWMAFFAQQDYAKGIAPYSDAFDLVDTTQDTLALDLLEPKKVLGLNAKLELVSRTDGLRVLPMSVGEDLGSYDEARRKKQMRISGAPGGWNSTQFFSGILGSRLYTRVSHSYSKRQGLCRRNRPARRFHDGIG